LLTVSQFLSLWFCSMVKYPKSCSRCSVLKEREDFPKRHHGACCRQCVNEKQRIQRKENSNKHSKAYEKAPSGYLMRTYRNMLSRTNGVLKSKAHLYFGLEIMSKEEFYSWSLKDEAFLSLFATYKESGWDFKNAPSIDRINTQKGYTRENSRWISHKENSRLGAISRHSGGKND